MAGKRSYNDACGIARALDVIGERWALLVVRELVFGPKRFTDLRAGLPQIGPDVLTQRLRDLETAGIVHKRTLPPPARAQVYELTPRGYDLEPVLLALGRWGTAVPFDPERTHFGPEAFLLALKTTFDPAGARDIDVALVFGEDAVRVRVRGRDGRLDIARGQPDGADATIASDTGTLSQVLWRGLALDALALTGSKAAVARFVRAFAVAIADPG